MKNNTILIIGTMFFVNTAFSQVAEIENMPVVQKPKKYFAVGFLDHKTGMSLVGVARTLWQDEHHEIFVGAGTLIAMVSATIGWKYYFKNAPLNAYSVLSIQSASAMGGSFVAPIISLGVEKNIYKQWYFNAGAISMIRPHPDKAFEFVTFPAININRRY